MADQDKNALIGPILLKGMQRFSFNLYQKLKNETGNVVFSPYSVSSALLLTRLGLKGHSETEISAALGLDELDYGVVNEAFKKFEEGILATKVEGTSLAAANRIFVKLGLSVKERYSEDSLKFYRSGIEELDFEAETEESRLKINAWVEEQTKEKIKNLLAEGSITGRTKMVLTNAVYFKGKWENSFNSEMTKKQDFQVSTNEKVQVNMMTKKFKLPYTENAGKKFSAVDLPYEGKTASMTIVLPDSVDGLKELEENFTADDFNGLCRDFEIETPLDVTIYIPRFSLEENYYLTDTLSALGIKQIFSESADFGGMFDNTDGINMSDVIHKTFIDVTEEGTEAAAATAMISRMMLLPQKEIFFKCDHPFLFFIRELKTNTTLFMGRYVKP